MELTNQSILVAEAGSNHNGDIEQAKRLIDIAVEAKVDAVKFQLFKSEFLVKKKKTNKRIKKNMNLIGSG